MQTFFRNAMKKKDRRALYIRHRGERDLVRFYFQDGEIYHLTYGPVKDRGMPRHPRLLLRFRPNNILHQP